MSARNKDSILKELVHGLGKGGDPKILATMVEIIEQDTNTLIDKPLIYPTILRIVSCKLCLKYIPCFQSLAF